MGKLRIISIILVVVLFSLSCGSMEYDTAQKFINNCKYKITMFGSNTIRYANSYEIKDGFVIIEEYASDTWDSVFSVSQKKLMLPVSKTIIQELR